MTINSDVVQFAVDNMGTRVGAGECFDLADRALRNAGARSAADYGEIGANTDYVWGDSVERNQAQAGDIIQFRSYEMEITTEVRFPDGSSETTIQSQTRPHHTAMVASIGRNGQMNVYEQNVGEGSTRRTVQNNSLEFATHTQEATEQRDGQRVTIVTRVVVRGQVWFYHPVARED